MLVKNWMTKDVITVNLHDPMYKAAQLMKEHDITMLPVMEKNKLVGIVTDGDIKKASASSATTLEVHELLYLISRIKVKEIMTPNPITVPVDYTVEEAAEVLLFNKINGAPILDYEKKLVGVITEKDLFKVLITLTGVGKRGVEFAFRLKDRPGSIKEVADIIRKYGGRMASILSTYESVPEGYRNVYIRMYNIDRARLPQLEEELKANVRVLYIVDHRENRREIYV